MSIKTMDYFVNGKWETSKTTEYSDIYNPSTGEVTHRVPICTVDEVEQAIEAAAVAYKSWSNTPVVRRTKVLYKFRELLEANFDELVELCSREHGKTLGESQGDIMKVLESVEFACGMPTLLMGEALMDTSTGFDTVLYKEPVGVFAGIAPFNFPGMIPMGWMAPLCIAAGNTMVLKLSSTTPLTAMRLMELWEDAGLPNGVLNVLTCNRKAADVLLTHPKIAGISFVGSTPVGLQIYTKAAAAGKRVQALCEAKNHALVLEDAELPRTARGIINAAYGCAGQRCMALPAIVVQESVADELVRLLTEYAREMKIGPAYDPTSVLGPVTTAGQKANITKWIEKGIEEGAELVLDGRDVTVDGFENGFYLGPTIFDHVKEGMTVGDEEIFGPVLCVKRVKDFEEGLTLMNANRFANGSVIFTNSGYYAREFSKRTHGGMVGINVGIPVPVGIFPFTGHKQSFFGDLHALGKDGVRFFTETKAVTSRWFDEEEKKKTHVDTWDGAIGGS